MCIKYLLYWVDNMALSFVYLCATQTLPPFFPISKHFLWATHGAEIVSGLAQRIVFKWSDSKGFSCRFKVHLYLCVCVCEREKSVCRWKSVSHSMMGKQQLLRPCWAMEPRRLRYKIWKRANQMAKIKHSMRNVWKIDVEMNWNWNWAIACVNTKCHCFSLHTCIVILCFEFIKKKKSEKFQVNLKFNTGPSTA